jgi:hypothetical protein
MANINPQKKAKSSKYEPLVVFAFVNIIHAKMMVTTAAANHKYIRNE